MTHPARSFVVRAVIAALAGLAAHPAMAQSAPATAPPAAASPSPAPAAAAEAPAPASAPPAVPAPRTQVAENETGASVLPEIVVTATRHAELLSKVPISISAFTQDTIDLKGIKDITDVIRYTPGMIIDADGTNTISIRGISSSAGAATTGVYIDDTPIQMRVLGFNADNALPKTFDLERMEVLRGPQGTLFGAGAEGGAVRYIMAQPNMTKSDMYVRSEVAMTQNGAPSYEVGVAGGTPIVANVLGMRASLWYRHDGGWIDRLDPFSFATVAHNSNYEDTVALRLASKWAVNDDVTITPSMLYQDRRTNDVSTYFPFLSDPGNSVYKNAWGLPRHEPDKYFLPALKIETELGKASFISNTSYYTRHDLSGYDGTVYNLGYYQTFWEQGYCQNGAAPPCTQPSWYPLIDGTGFHLPTALQNYRANGPVTNQQQTFAQEFRLQSNDATAPLQWTAGLFYSSNHQRSVEEINDPMADTLLQGLFGLSTVDIFGVPLLPNGDSYINNSYTRDRQLAVFGEVTYALTDKIKGTVGLRYSKTDVNFDNYADGPQNFGTSPDTPGEQHEKPFTPKLSLSYQADRDNMFYATFAKGFRIGGANAFVPPGACAVDLGNLGLTQVPSSYKSDSVNSYEIGAKNKIADQLRIASSLYYITWNGIQQNIYMSGCGFQFTSNLGSAVSKGGDIQLEYVPSQAWSFDLAIGHTIAYLTSDVGIAPNLVASKGDAVEGLSYGPAPPWTVAIGAQYDFTAFDRKSFVRMDWEYTGHSNALTPTEDPRAIGSYDPLIYTPGSSNFVSLRAGTAIGEWNVSAFVDNLLDTHPSALDSSDYHSAVDPYNANPPSALMTAYTFRPRTIGITATYHMK
jgi:iron complex outermembrane recepter protein